MTDPHHVLAAADSVTAPDPELLRQAIVGIIPNGPAQRNLLLSFDRLISNWSDRAAHQACAYEATQSGELMMLGKLYRAILEQSPEDPEAIAAQKRIAAAAMFAAGAVPRGAAGPRRKIPRWVYPSGGISLVWLIFDLIVQGTFSWIDVAMVLVCAGSIGYAVYTSRR